MKNRWKQNPIIWKKQNFDSIKKTNPGKESIMERRSMWSRLLAIVLAVSMVFSSQSMSVFADTLAIIQQPQDTNEKKNQPADDTSKDNQETSEESEEETTAAEEPQQSEPAEESSEAQQEQTVQMTGTINGENVNLRSEPSTSSEVLSKAQTGDVVSILGEVTGDDGNTWYEILYGQGSAFVSAEYVTVTEAESESETEAATEPETAAEEETQSEAAKKARTAKQVTSLEIEADRKAAVPGTNITLKRKDSVEIGEGQKLQWQLSTDNGTSWQNIRNATADTYTFRFEDSNAGYSYRLVLTDTEDNVIEGSESNPITIQRMTPNDLADSYYGDDVANPRAMAQVSMTYTGSQGTSVKAGDTLDYTINYQMKQPPLYNYGTEAAYLFKEYTGTNITLILPKGTTLDNPGQIVGATTSDTPEKVTEDGREIWKFNLEESLATNATGSFDIHVRVTGNGTVGIGETYAVSRDDLKISTTGTVWDQTDPSKPVYGTPYDQTQSAMTVPDEATAATDDVWGIRKSFKNSTENADGTITVNFTLEVGLWRNNTIVTDPESYNVVGRVPFKENTIQLTENLALTGRDGESIIPKEVTLTDNYGDEPQTLNAENQWTAVVHTDTCEGHVQDKNDLSTVASTAPYYSTYEVSAVYQYDDFVVDFYENPDTEQLTLTNTATLTYTLLGGSQAIHSSEATAKLGGVNQPAVLTIEKYIEDYLTTEQKLYKTENVESDISGSVTFKVTKKNSTEAALYTYKDGKYTKMPDNTVTISPAGDGAGTATVYLEPGEYTIEETQEPTNTAMAEPQTVNLLVGANEPVKFVNKENLGNLEIVKVDSNNKPIAGGAKFEVYNSEGCSAETKVCEGTTGGDGTLTFTRLKPGSYWIKEVSAPNGYVISKAITEVTVKANETVSVNVINEENSAKVKLQKRFVDNSGNTTNVNESNYHLFNGCFSIERKNLDGGWEEVRSKLSLNTMGQTDEISLPVYDIAEDGSKTPITYHFKEKLPVGWHGEDSSKESTVNGENYYVSGDFTLTDESGAILTDTKQMDMTNTQNGTLILTKKFVEASTGKQVERPASAGEASFDLYQQVGEEVSLKKVGNTHQTDPSGMIRISDLPRTSGGKTIYYYLVEVNPKAGYRMYADPIKTVQIDGKNVTAIGPFDFNAGGDQDKPATLEYTVEVKNVQQLVPIQVLKKDADTQRNIDGAIIKIEKLKGYKSETQPGEVIETKENITVPETGYIQLVEPGYAYRITETKAPSNYIKSEESYFVDLSDVTEIKPDETNFLRQVTIYNTPYPKVTVTKYVLKADSQPSLNTSIQFSVYKKNGESFEAVTDSSGKPIVFTAGSTVQLEPGNYYLKEIVDAGDKVIDIADHEDLYKNLDAKYQSKYETDSAGAVYFGPYPVTAKKEIQNLDDIYNISSLGNVKIIKKDEKGTPLSGATLEIYTKEGDKAIVKGSGVSAVGTGEVVFRDLPVYGENGEKITYYIRETKAPDGYYVTSEEIEVTLEAGKTIFAKEGRPLELVNHPYTQFTVKKVYRNLWEFEFTNRQILLDGTKIALYKRLENGNYEFVESGITGMDGTVTFDQLQGTDYVVIEMSYPDLGWAMEPEGGKQLLPEGVETLTEADLENYNYVKMWEEGEDTLVNVQGWTQLRLYKYKMTFNPESPTYDQDMKNAAEGTVNTVNETYKVPQNNSVFTLYKQELENTDTDAALSFNAGDCTPIGTYTSGSMIGSDGKPMDGYFATDILESADNIVYWLVETEAGPGGAIIPEKNYVLFSREGTNYQNISNGGNSTTAYHYYDQSITQVELENDATYGGGTAYYAKVQLSKWAGEIDSDGNKQKNEYQALGNAKYELYVVGSDGREIAYVDSLTTGLENTLGDVRPGDGSAGDATGGSASDNKALTSAAMSTLLYYDGGDDNESPTKGFARYDAEEQEGIPQDITWAEGVNGIIYDTIAEIPPDVQIAHYYVRMAIKETYAPTGYQKDGRTYYMIVQFGGEGDKVGGTTINDAYYVAEKGSDVPLAEDQKDIVWAKKGEHYRLVNWPDDRYMVTVNKYGYTPTKDTINNTAKMLDDMDSLQRTSLDVTLYLERYDTSEDTWKYFDGVNYVENRDSAKIVTESGRATLQLRSGEYRLTEDNVSNEYVRLYDGSSVTGGDKKYNAAARYFKVGNSDISISMYNPKKLSLAIQKTDINGTPVTNEFTFTLNQKGKDPISATTVNGQASFANIDKGTYWLKESGNGLSTEYLEEYLNYKYSDGKYKGFANFGKENVGIELGYTTVLSGNDMVVSEIKDFAYYQVETGGILRIANPSLGSITVEKVDEQNEAKKLPEAKFKLYYKPFTAFDGKQTIPAASEITRPIDSEIRTGTDGTHTWKNLSPGFYRIEETAPPTDYEKTDSDKIVMLTGNMDITLAEGTVDALGTGSGNDIPTVTVKNRSLATLSITKEVKAGAITVDPADEFTFELYTEQTGGTAKETITVKAGQTGEISGLSQGTYYLQETHGTEYALESVEVDGEQQEPEAVGGRYKIEVTDSEVAVKVTNLYLYAKVTFKKVNSTTGAKLSGAEFEVKRVTKDGESKVDSVVWDKTQEAAGIYTVTIPLEGKAEETFRIYETKAPEYHVVSNIPIEVKLTPGEHESYTEQWDPDWLKDKDTMRKNLYMPNDNGVFIELTKFNNVQESNPTGHVSGAQFTLYQYIETQKQWREYGAITTLDGGKIRFTAPSGYEYAIAETNKVSGYVGLQGIYLNVNGETTPLSTESINGHTAYILGKELQAGETYYYNAYNIPEISLEVRKADNSGAGVVPTAQISVYDITDVKDKPSTGAKLTKEAVLSLKSSGTLVKTVDTEKVTGQNYSSASGIKVQGGKTYLIVEEKVIGGYQTMILDDNRTNWYQVLEIAKGATQVDPVTLTNVSGHVDLELSKSISGADKDFTFKNLFDTDQTVTYTLSPTIGNNTYGLLSYTLTDTGLKAYHKSKDAQGKEKIDEIQNMGAWYSIKKVALTKPTHVTSMYEGITDNSIKAMVTFKDFGGKTVGDSKIVGFTENSTTVDAPEGDIASVEIKYYSEGLKDKTGYELGQNFVPGNVDISVEIPLRDSGETVQSVDRISNSAQADVTYYEWDSEGNQGGEAKRATSITKTKTTEADVESHDGPKVSVEKTTNAENVALDQVQTYEITVTNQSDSTEKMINPIIVDVLPTGSQLNTEDDSETGNEEHVDPIRFKEGSGAGLTLGSPTIESFGEEKAVVIKLTGELGIGESVVIQIDVKVTKGVVSHGDEMTNVALVTSGEKGVKSSDNKAGSSFKDNSGNWAGDLRTVAGSYWDAETVDKLVTALSTTGDNGFISASATSRWVNNSGMTLLKEIKGHLDDEFSTRLTTISNRKDGDSNSGKVEYRLTVSNTDSALKRTNITVMDMLPQDGDFLMGGDERYSQWSLYLEGEPTVTRSNGQPISRDSYEVYYYTGALSALNYDAAKEAQTKKPSGDWTEQYSRDNVKAFIIALDNTVSLASGESLVVTYTTRINEMTPEELADNANQNAVNSFVCHYSSYAAEGGTPDNATSENTSNQSDIVSTTIIPGTVSVGGEIWIDANGDGTRQAEEELSNYRQYKIVKNLLSGIEVKLQPYTGYTPGSAVTFGKPENPAENWNGSYRFDQLIPSALTVDDANGYDGENNLLVSKLKGNKDNYQLVVTGTGDFSITDQGSKHSSDPEHLTSAEQTDSNFDQQGNSERFYLWSTEESVYDDSKDLGLKLYRDLEINKYAEDGTTKVDNAEFAVYGPFNNAEAAEKAVKDGSFKNASKVTTTTTDGKAVFEDLHWFKAYVIEETKAASGYEIKGANAEKIGGSATQLEEVGEGIWVLGIPDTEYTGTKEEIKVTNVRQTKVTLKAHKTLQNKTLASGDFSFELLDADKGFIETKSNDENGDVTFSELTFEGVDEWSYYIREVIPEEANRKTDVEYDHTLYKVVVTTRWDLEKQELIAETKYYQVTTNSDGSESLTSSSEEKAEFTNKYNPTGSWSPEGTKTLTGRDMKEGETFTFKVLVKTGGDEQGEDTFDETGITGTASNGKNGKPVNIDFGEQKIEYSYTDIGKDYTYRIIEEHGTDGYGLTYDKTYYTVTVKVTDDAEKGLNVEAEYRNSDKNEKVDQATFVNEYKPASVGRAPMVQKTVTGDDRPQGTKEFTFSLNPVETYATDAVDMPENTELTLEFSNTEQSKSGSFSNITFKKAGDYSFTIKEKAGNDAGYTYSQDTWTWTVKVTDNLDGTLSINESYYKNGQLIENAENASFTNTYKPVETSYPPVVQKIVEGNEVPTGKEETFTFTLEKRDWNPEDGAELSDSANATEISVKGEGTETFAPIKFTKAGTYRFTIREREPEENERKNGYSYDGSVWTLTVTVEDNNGKLEATPVYTVQTPENREAPSPETPKAVFRNTYTPDKVIYAPQVKKEITGASVPEDAEKTFNFTMNVIANPDAGAAIGDKPLTEGQKLHTSVVGASTAPFAEITFSKAGTYQFEISEDKLDPAEYPGYSHDDSVWKLTVNVNDNDGQLVKDVTYTEVGTKPLVTSKNEATFTNSYAVVDTEYPPKVKKIVTGDIPKNTDQTFKFILSADNEKNPENGAELPKNTELSLKGNGNEQLEGLFDSIIFHKAGDYTFYIKEDTTGQPQGYTYDTRKWTLTLTVVDDAHQLKVKEDSIKYTQEITAAVNEEAASFTNRYQPLDVKYAPAVKKIVTGDERPKDTSKTFTFTMTAGKDYGDAIDMPTSSSIKLTVTSGETETSGTFGEITFKKQGTYIFNITEVNETGKGYTFDTTPWQLNVTVTDSNGQLKIEKTDIVYSAAGKDSSNTEATFTNSYKVTGTDFIPKVTKSISATSDKRPVEKTFKFTLTPDEKNPKDEEIGSRETFVVIPAGNSTEKVTNTFEKISYKTAGTYHYTIEEALLNDTEYLGYERDNSKWNLTVVIEDKDGQLTVNQELTKYEKAESEGIIEAETAEFVNSYQPKETRYSPSVTKIVSGAQVADTAKKEFTFTLEANKSNAPGAILTGDTRITILGGNSAETKTFGSIKFTKEGTYAFTIKEDEVTYPGYESYDRSEWTLTVEVEDQNGQLTVIKHTYTADGKAQNNETASFNNEYKVSSTTYQPEVQKTVSGDVPKDKEYTFNFELKAEEQDGLEMPGNTKASVTVTGDEKTKTTEFDKVTFKKAGIYHFTINEVDTNKIPGYTYDGTIWSLTVKVEDINHELTVTETTYTAQGKPSSTKHASFENSYSTTEIGYTPAVWKNFRIDSAERPDKKEFKFILKPNGTYEGVTVANKPLLETTELEAKVSGEGQGVFDTITFTKTGTYKFTVHEVGGEEKGYQYDTSMWTLSVNVTDEDSHLAAKATYTKGDETREDYAVFTNGYTVTEITYEPLVKKSLTGETRPDEKEFRFTIEQKSTNGPGASISDPEVEITGAGTIKFAPITFKAAGTYDFVISEKAGSDYGYDYDRSTWNLQIKVEDNDSQLEVKSHIYTKVNGTSEDTNNEKASFVNDYQVDSIPYAPKVVKVLTGEERPEEKVFTFTLQPDETNPKDGAVLENTTVSITGESETSFGNIQFKKAGLYKFTIQETKGSEAGYGYDESKWTLTVEIADEGGKLAVKSHTYTKVEIDEETGEETLVSRDDSALFTNDYSVTEISYIPYVEKQLQGDATPTDKKFTFTITADEQNKAGGAIIGSAETTVTGTGRQPFDAITFKKAGTYHFYIAEKDSGENGYTYDKNIWTLTVAVEDKGGRLEVIDYDYKSGEETQKEQAVFTNIYEVKGTNYAPTVEKVVTEDTPKDEEFTFTLVAKPGNPDGGARLPENAKLTINGNGKKSFDPIGFDKAGIYYFEIKEEAGNVPGYSYDGSVWTLKVQVDDVDSQLTVVEEKIVYSKIMENGGEETSGTQAKFNNSYSTTEIQYTPQVTKELTGETTPTDETFTFTLEAVKDYEGVSFTRTDASVTGAGNTNFGSITFTKRGDYEFRIKEVAGTEAGYGYDENEWILTVKIEDQNSQLVVASQEYKKVDQETGNEVSNETAAIFTNTYTVTPTGYTPSVEKILTGTPANAEEFVFTLSANTENPEGAVLPENTELTIPGSGIADFDEIQFQKAGTYVFEIVEKDGGNTWYEYDPSVWTLTVTIKDNASVLEVESIVYEKDGVEQTGQGRAVFENHYRASGEVLLDNFTKTLNGSPLAAGQFTFQLKDEEGNVLQTVTNAADGSIPFEALTYDESDIGQEYTYTVSEVNNNVTGVAYDTTIYTVIVAVADSENSDGTLDITTTILNGEETIEGEEGALPSITFTNTFGGTVTLTKQNDRQQVLAGAEFQLYARTEGADTYEVYASEGNAEGRYTTDVNGQIQITDLPANDYYFVETKAPQGYVIETDEAGQPLHYDFTIGVQDGVAGIAENAVVNAALTVTNAGATTGSIQVTKRVGRIGDNFDIVDLVAVNETYYVGLFLDAAGTQPYGTDNVKAIQMNGVSVSEAVTFDNLPSGTYYVLETDAQGNPIVMNETQTTADGGSYYCTLEEGQNNQVTVDLTVSEEPGTVMLTNVYLEFSEDYYWDATIDITKRVLRNGEEATADDTFYAGVYQMLEDGSYELLTEVELQQNDTVTVTGLGGPIGESMTYYVFETDGNGNRVSEDPAFRYAVSGEGSVTVTQDSTAGSITITNEYEEEEPTEEPSEKPTEKPSERPTEPTTKSTDAKDTEPTTTTSTKATKTGDTTDLTVELLLMAVAAVLMGTSVYARKRRRNRR